MRLDSLCLAPICIGLTAWIFGSPVHLYCDTEGLHASHMTLHATASCLPAEEVPASIEPNDSTAAAVLRTHPRNKTPTSSASRPKPERCLDGVTLCDAGDAGCHNLPDPNPSCAHSPTGDNPSMISARPNGLQPAIDRNRLCLRGSDTRLSESSRRYSTGAGHLAANQYRGPSTTS